MTKNIKGLIEKRFPKKISLQLFLESAQTVTRSYSYWHVIPQLW